MKSSTVWLVSICGSLLLLTYFSVFFLSDSFHLEETSELNVSNQVYTLEDTGSSLCFQDILKPESQNRFKKNTEDLIRFNNSTSAVWIRFTVINPSPDLYCELSTSNIHHVTFFSPDSSGSYNTCETGFLHPFKSRKLMIDRFAFPVSSESNWYYIRIKSDHFLNTALHLSTAEYFYKKSFLRIVLYSVYAGIMLIIAAFALLLTVQNRKPFFLLYFGYVLSITTINLIEKGFLFQFVWPFHANINSYFPLIPYGVSFSLLFFLERLFGVRKFIPIFYKITLLGINALPFLATVTLLLLLHNYFVAIIITQVHSIVICLAVTAISIVAYIKSPNFRPSLLILIIGLSIFQLSVIIYLLSENAILEITALTENSILIGSSIEVLFFTTTIINYQRSLKDRLLILVRQQNQQLHSRVEERTEELRLNNERLEDLIQEKDSLMNIMAHDLKTPLNQAKALSQLIQMVMKENIDEAQNLAHRIEKVSNHGLQLIKEIFEAALLESTQQSITFLPVNLKQLCQEVIDNFNQVAKKKNIKLYFSCECEINVHTHAPHVVRILENILSNAIKFSPCNSTVETTLKEINSAVVISIKDKGPGFREEDKKRMFKKFQRLSALPTGGESSNGLGLYITKTLADRVHAQLVMESESGLGSVFSLSFHGNNSIAAPETELKSHEGIPINQDH